LRAIHPATGATTFEFYGMARRVHGSERDSGKRAGLSTSERDRVKDLERENRELKRANEILRKASAYFAQAELDRRGK
jgi:transposase